ncbi:MAG: GTP pyrophosphokinase family protein [Anaerostipes sp.]|nr:GTP pyrophosphokinase family protein [Anaerostipes sp.]
MGVEEFFNQAKERFIRDNLMSDDFIAFMENNTKPMATLMAYYRCANMEIETKFKVLNEQFSLNYDRNPIESIKTRIKSMESIVKKTRSRNIPLTIEALEENITDIAGVRVICSFPKDIYYLAECLLRQDDIELIRKKDYIKNPKKSGYRSLHLIVQVPIFLQDEKRLMKVEVQLRTIAMDFWASLEHKLRYKKNIPEDEADQLAEELMECARMSADMDQRMEDIRNRIVLSEAKYDTMNQTEKGKQAGNDYLKSKLFEFFEQ